MATLYHRATPSQRLVLRMIEGAVKNAFHAHPDLSKIPLDKLARSIAKRAAGTLTAQWPEVLARTTRTSSERASKATATLPAGCAVQTTKRAMQAAVIASNRRRLLADLHKTLSMAAGQARRAGNTERLEGLRDALRAVSAAAKRTPAP